MNLNDKQNLSLFDINDTQKNFNSKIDVVKLEYVEAEAMTWQELFCGFDKLKAITFSSGINFVYNLFDMFADVEVIFGCESVMSFSFQEILAYQSAMIERIRDFESRSKQKVIDRIEDGTVHFYIANKQLSHEKIYLLEAKDGRKRVVMGSANMSYNAFSGIQRENICCVDGGSAYDWYLEKFYDLKENSTDKISKKAILKADVYENMDNLPISESIKVKKVMVIEPVKELDKEVEFVLDVHNLSKELTPIVPKCDKKTGKVAVSVDSLTRLQRHRSDEIIKEKELRSEYPQLKVDYEKSSICLNGQMVDLNPSKDNVKSDVQLFIKYMDGYSKFHGDYEGVQYRYFEFANWFFCSPFMAKMRDMAARFNQNKLPYPVFGLVYGQSKAGKTSFLETLLKMMIGQKPKISAPDFTRSSIEALKNTVEGAPIIVDDLTQSRFSQHAIETIKNDDFGVGEHNVNYPAVVISANEDVKAVAPEVIRRTVICRVNAGLTNTEVMKSNVVRTVQQKIGTAFYREYLRRMLENIPELIELIKDDEAESAPDILELSSKIICEIISENVDEIPQYIRMLTLEDYFSEHVTGKHAKDTIVTAWKTTPKAFAVHAKSNELRYNAGQTYEADRLMKELPETLEARKSREWIVMNLAEAKKFFGFDFKKGLFSRK